MKLRQFVFLFVLLVLCSNIIATPYTFKRLDVVDGLSNNYVLDILQDKRGLIWVATESGLNRFDGKHFTVFDKNTSGLVNNTINKLLYDDEEDALWIASREGLSILDCSTMTFRNYVSHNNVTLKNVVSLSPASDGGIWVINHFGGIMHYNKKTKQFSPYFDETIKEAASRHLSVYDDGNGTLYLGHSQTGLSVIDLKTNTAKNYRHSPNDPRSLPGNRVYSIYTDSQQNIWIGTDHGLALFDPQTENFLVFNHNPANPYSLIADHVYCIKEMNDATLWIATDVGGISIMNLRENRFVKPEEVRFFNLSSTNDKEGLSSNKIRSLLQDSFGNIWIGNYSSGIDFISRYKLPFEILPYTETGITLKHKPVWGVYADYDNRVWMGGQNEVIVFENNKLQKKISIGGYTKRPYAQVLSITRNKQGLFWFGLYDDGLLTYEETTNRFERIELDIENMDILTLYEDAKGKMWIGAEFGVYSYLNGRVTREENIIAQLQDRSIYGILHDKQGKLWVASYSKGVYVFDDDEKLLLNLQAKKGLSSDFVNQLIMDSNGGIWVATHDGITYIEDTNFPEKHCFYGFEQGLTDTHVRAIHEDNTGNIWISTHNGISFFNKKNNKFSNYDFKDGISSGNFIEGSVCSTSDGTIYFGSLNGACYFNPKELTFEHPISPVQIISCEGFNKNTENRGVEYDIPLVDGNINLPYNKNTFHVSFAVPDYSQSNQVEYSYRIEGLENTWLDTQGENQITLRNLSPGKYCFQVKARLKNQDWDSHAASLNIRINPPLWLTWYAKLLYLAVICVIAFYLLKSYKNRLNLKASVKLNDERLRFYTNITHELRTPLTLILGPLEDLSDAADIPFPHKNKIQTIHSSSIRLLNLINKILEFRKTETQNRELIVQKADLACSVKEIGLRYKELNQNRNTNIHIEIQSDDTLLYYDEDVITMILDNLLLNAIKYTPAGEIRLVLRSVKEIDNTYTEVEVSDTGYGIDKQILPYIFDRYYQVKSKHQASGTGIGLALVKSLVELHEGILSVESVLGKGTIFRFRLLTGNTYPNACHCDAKAEEIEEEIIDNLKTPEKEILPMILVIEDNNEIRDYIVSSFSSIYNVLTAINGREGLEIAQEKMPDIIISDVMMPEMDGLELCRVLKGDIRTSHIPIILLTAKDSIRDKEEGYESGADSYLTKPFSAKLLGSRIHNILVARERQTDQVAARTKGIKIKPVEISRDILPISRIDEEFLEKITALIEENLDMEKLDISFLREKVNMSHSTFYRKIKALTGVSAAEYIRKVKLKNGLKLLMTGTYNVSEVAYMIGFNNLSYFGQCFKDEYGMLPSEYIRKIKGEESLEIN